MRHVPFAAVVLAGLIASLPTGLLAVSTAQQSGSPAMPSTSALAERATRELFLPVKAALSEQLAGDPKLSALISNITVETLGTTDPHLGRNAEATTKTGARVKVDLIFLAELLQEAALAGVGLTRTDPAGALVQSKLRQRDRQLAAKNTPLPDFEVSVAKLESPVREIAVRLGVEVGLTAATWVLLHEIGHHVEGNFEAVRRSESRRLEAAADEWAYKKLYELGYHLHYLATYFQLKEVLEEMELKYGLALPEDRSTHPLWSTRLANLEKLYDVDKPTPVRMLSYLGVGWDSVGRPVPIEVMLPRYPDEDIQLVATIWTGTKSASNICDWSNGEAHIYGRSAGTVTDVTIHKPLDMRTPVTVVNRRLATGEQQKMERIWIQTTLAWARPRKIANIPVSVVLDSPVVTVLRESLRSAGVDSKTSEAVITQFSDFLSVLRRGLVRYGRGETSLESFAVLMNARSEEFSTRLQKTLGPRWSKSLDEQFTTNPTLMAMMEAVMKPQ